MKAEESKWVAIARRWILVVLFIVTVLLLTLYLLPARSPEEIELDTLIQSGEVESWELRDWGFAARTERWEIYFTAPSGEADRSEYHGGLDAELVAAIDAAERTLELAAYDFGQERLAAALLRAKERGVALRIVADDTNRGEFAELAAAAIPIRFDERSALMHNKFIVIDGREVWVGSMNFTENGLYRNNNHLLRFRQPELVAAYRAEFEEMFRGDFGSRSEPSNRAEIQQGVHQYSVLFIPEYDPNAALLAAIQGAEESIHFMVFSFTLDDLALALLEKGGEDIVIQGVFDSRLARGMGSEYLRLYCAGSPRLSGWQSFRHASQGLHHR